MASSDEILLAAIIKQVAIKGIDYRKLANDISAVSAGAAEKRWSRYRKMLMGATRDVGSDKGSPAKPAGVQKNGKKSGRVNVTDVKKEREGSVEAEAGDTDREGRELVAATPTKKLPSRSAKSKIKTFKVKEEEEEEEEPEEDEEEDEDEA
jgi:hypothetical protein